MTTDRELDEILAEIGREHRAIGAPERLESVLCAAAGSRRNCHRQAEVEIRMDLGCGGDPAGRGCDCRGHLADAEKSSTAKSTGAVCAGARGQT